MTMNPENTSNVPSADSPRLVTVPSCLGLPKQTAVKSLGLAGLNSHITRFIESYEPEKTVVAQDPLPGTVAESDAPVTLFISQRSLVEYLPAAYRSPNHGESSFMGNFLWIFQHIYDSVTDHLDEMDSLFSPLETPPQFLDWMAGWFDIAMDSAIPLERRRLIVSQTPRLFALRGTKQALIAMIRSFCDLDVSIVEHERPFTGLQVGVDCDVGLGTRVLSNQHSGQVFIVKVKVPSDQIDPETLRRLYWVVETEKPAQTSYFIDFSGQ